MPEILDDNNTTSNVNSKPSYPLAVSSLVCFIGLLIGQGAYYGTSETALVEGSYVWMPFLVLGVVSFGVSPKKALLAFLLTDVVLFIFYATIWGSL